MAPFHLSFSDEGRQHFEHLDARSQNAVSAELEWLTRLIADYEPEVQADVMLGSLSGYSLKLSLNGAAHTVEVLDVFDAHPLPG